VAENRTEKATPKRRDEARRKGQVAKSPEVASAAVVLAGVITLMVSAPSMFSRFLDVMQRGLAQSGDTTLATRDGGGSLVGWVLTSILYLVAPVALAAMMAGLVANVVQVRPQLNLGLAAPKLERVNPLQGFKRLFSKNALFDLGKTLAKTCVVGAAAGLSIWPRIPEISAAVGMPPAMLLVTVASSVLSLALWAGGAMALIAIVDFLWQRHRLETSLKMSKDEIKQEARQSDLAPEVRGAIRRRQFTQARKRMMAEVPTADVVITNPTHFAVALRYDGSKPAPEVIAKGADLVAAQIRRLAAENAVPVLENPPLARALYREVDIGHQIPDSFFAAVAEVLAFVYRTARRRPPAA
jgi:flagellar biosynthetic protein FlhB